MYHARFLVCHIKYVNIRVIYTLNKVIHCRTWSDIIVTDRYKWAVCGMQILSQHDV